MSSVADTQDFSRVFVSSVAALSLSACFFVACSDDSEPVGPGDVEPGGSTADGGTADGSGEQGADGGGGSESPLDVSNVQEKTWTWFEIPDTFCRDGSPTGIGLNLNPASKKMVIYLEGGGACFDMLTCSQNPSSVPRQSFSGGILDRAKQANPVADWNQVYVPYCTGDVHSGNNPNASIEGVQGTQKFVGYTNMGIFLRKLAATFPQTEQILLTGVSAGGFGAAANFGQAVKVFPSIRVNLIDDSGPLMHEPPLAHCLQEKWKTLWKLDTTVLAECGNDCAGQPDALMAATKHWASTKADQAQGLISATGDQTIRFFFGFGANDCSSAIPLSAANYEDGLEGIRDEHAGFQNFGTFYYEGTGHTIIGSDAFYTKEVGGKSLTAWVGDIVDSNTTSNVGP